MTLLIFDCDGTLIDSELLHAQSEVELLKEKFGVTYDIAEFNRRFSGVHSKQQYEILEKEIGRSFPPDFDEELHRRKNELFSKRVKPVPHIKEVLAQLATYPRCVASNTHLATIEISLRTAELYDLFAPHIYSAQMVARGKPAPDLFLYAAQQMNVPAQNCVVIEDSPRGIEAGLAAGMRVIGYIGGSHCYPGYAEKLQSAETIIADMRELPALL